MKIKYNLIRALVIAAILAVSTGTASGSAFAEGIEEDVLIISVTSSVVNCGDVLFEITIENGAPPYLIEINYGDGDPSESVVVGNSTDQIPYTYSIPHTYYDAGVYELFIRAEEEADFGWQGTTYGEITLNGPSVLLSSEPFPPLFVLGDAGEVEFFTDVTGGTVPTTYQWDLDGDGLFDTGETGIGASSAYTEVGKHMPQVKVTDGCDFTASDTIPVVVANPGEACHPTAQKIADGVNTIFPDQAADLYTCEDIYAIFE
ncbi:MAG: hypothetical protein HQ574_01770, partial [Chloroflexi bacterium]|nr:hypothetical protein [Chloroflexota bacterium]